MSFQETSPPAEKHIASQILFQEFCDLCEKIKNAKNKKVDILHRYIDDFRKRESKGMVRTVYHYFTHAQEAN